jgi:copper chaperone CopZ
VETTVAYTFAVDGMHCASCSMLIDDALKDVDGVIASTTSLRKRRTKVDLDPARCSTDDVITAITGAGYAARLEQK